MKRISLIIGVLISFLFAGVASAHCEPAQVAGVWSVEATAGSLATAGFARFTRDQKVAVDAIGSEGGSDPTSISIPLSSYALDWDPATTVLPSGLCKITATYKHDDVVEKYWFVYPGNSLPNTLMGGDAVVDSANAVGLTVSVKLVRRVTRVPS